MAWNTGNFAKGAAQGGIIPGLAYGFIGQDPAQEAENYYKQIPGSVHKELDPWANYGMDTTKHPGERLNQIGQNYQQSPGLQFAIQQAMQGAGHAQAAGGMAGSPQHEQMNMGLATNLANQDYYKWLESALGLHNTAYGHGQDASKGISDQIAQNLAARGSNAYIGAANENQAVGGAFGDVAGLLAAFFGG